MNYRIWIIGLLSLFSLSAQAATLNITFVRPTLYADNVTPLPPTAITSYEFRCRAGTTAGVTCPTLSLAGSVTSGAMTVTIPITGATVCIEGRAFAGPSNPSLYGTSADAQACKVFAAVPPSAPGQITVAVVIGVNIVPVYRIVNGNRDSVLAGFVDLGVSCTGPIQFSYRGKNWRKVAMTRVKWWNTKPTANVAAPCALAT